MFNKRIQLAVMGALASFGRTVSRSEAHPMNVRDFNERNAVREALADYQHQGKGKGKRTFKPSGAAALQRAAKTRRNIRKRSKK